MRRWCCLALVLTLLAGTACNDAYSQKRIRLRQERSSELAAGIERLEQHRRQRFEEIGPTLRKWWREDCELFQKRAPTVGDYVW